VLTKFGIREIRKECLKKEKFIWYATGFGVKTNVGEKTLLIDAHVSESQRNIELIENYIEFMRQCNKNLESFQYTMKNIVDLLNYLSR
jgi:phosphoribosylpyrophosphate synthetase